MEEHKCSVGSYLGTSQINNGAMYFCGQCDRIWRYGLEGWKQISPVLFRRDNTIDFPLTQTDIEIIHRCMDIAYDYDYAAVETDAYLDLWKRVLDVIYPKQVISNLSDSEISDTK